MTTCVVADAYIVMSYVQVATCGLQMGTATALAIAGSPGAGP
jgi:hypothetical protein